MEIISGERIAVFEPWKSASRDIARVVPSTTFSRKPALGESASWNNIFTNLPHSRRKAERGVLSCDFRRLLQEDQQRQREQEFKRFAESGVGTWRVEDGEGMCGGFAEMLDARHVTNDWGGEELWNQPSVFHEAMPDSQISTFLEQQQQDERGGFWNDFANFEESWDRSQTLAAQRLQQVCSHIEQNLSPSHHLLQSIHDLSSQSDDVQVTYFSCSHDDCHSRLARINANFSLDWKMRPCPHSGCGYVSQNVEEWIAHCTTSEHSHPTACSWCRSAEDRHALWH